jgi:hypothetical protein
MAVFADQLMKLAAAIKHGLRLVQKRRRRSRATQEEEDAGTAPCHDNSLNELLESRLRQIIAAAPAQDPEHPWLVHAVVVPACPDSVCRRHRLTVQSCFQAAQPQVG